MNHNSRRHPFINHGYSPWQYGDTHSRRKQLASAEQRAELADLALSLGRRFSPALTYEQADLVLRKWRHRAKRLGV